MFRYSPCAHEESNGVSLLFATTVDFHGWGADVELLTPNMCPASDQYGDTNVDHLFSSSLVSIDDTLHSLPEFG